ncbi:MAG: T9SS type A sorting domain-containing protein [Saprospiraceae bacterium]|nr:T9SS type A sorting domain-containing protein [Saprospiraceae bacterium]
MKKIICLLILVNVLITDLLSQVAGSDNCSSAPIQPNPTYLNGILKPADYSNEDGPVPLCPNGGKIHNIQWWGFTSNGGNVEFQVSSINCSNGNGLQFALLKNCNSANPIYCKSTCNEFGSTYIFSANLEPCEYYTFWVDGCTGDMCDLNFSVVGTIPDCGVSDPETINLDPDGIIETCQSTETNIFIPKIPISGIKYKWTLNNNVLTNKTNSFNYNFKTVGTFEICVNGFMESASGQVYANSEKTCASVKVKPAGKVILPNKFLCYDEVNPKPFKWFDNEITESGSYSRKYINSSGCEIEEIINIQVNPKPEDIEIWHIGSDNKDYYVDPFGKLITDCSKSYLFSKKNGNICSDYYSVKQFLPAFEGKLELSCQNNKLYFKPIIQNNSCFTTNEAKINYSYILKNLQDPKSEAIYSDNLLEVKNKATYTLFLTAEITYGQSTNTLSLNLGEENIDESLYINNGGVDIISKTLGAFTKANSSQSGHWKYVKGPGNLSFENTNKARTRVTGSAKGTYVLQWETKSGDCTFIDEVRIHLGMNNEDGKLKIPILINPLKNDGNTSLVKVGSEISLSELFKEESTFIAYWYTLEGKLISNSQSSNLIHSVISPKIPGLYILTIEGNNQVITRKIQVIE